MEAQHMYVRVLMHRISTTICRKYQQHRQRQTSALLHHLRSNHNCFWPTPDPFGDPTNPTCRLGQPCSLDTVRQLGGSIYKGTQAILSDVGIVYAEMKRVLIFTDIPMHTVEYLHNIVIPWRQLDTQALRHQTPRPP